MSSVGAVILSLLGILPAYRPRPTLVEADALAVGADDDASDDVVDASTPEYDPVGDDLSDRLMIGEADYPECKTYADTAAFLIWYSLTYPDLIGVPHFVLMSRYQVFCCTRCVRPLSVRKIEQELPGLGCKRRRPRRISTGNRYTAYDLPAASISSISPGWDQDQPMQMAA